MGPEPVTRSQANVLHHQLCVLVPSHPLVLYTSLKTPCWEKVEEKPPVQGVEMTGWGALREASWGAQIVSWGVAGLTGCASRALYRAVGRRVMHLSPQDTTSLPALQETPTEASPGWKTLRPCWLVFYYQWILHITICKKCLLRKVSLNRNIYRTRLK